MAFFGMFKIGNNNEAASSIQRGDILNKKQHFALLMTIVEAEVISILKPMLDKEG